MRRIPRSSGLLAVAAAAAATVAFIAPPPVDATIYVIDRQPATDPADPAIASADAIIVGEVVGARAEWRGGRIVTRGRIQVLASLKGRAASVVAVEVPGGKVGGVVMEVIGGARLVTGQRTLLYLRQAGAVHVVQGLAHGARPIWIDSSGVVQVERVDGSSVPLAEVEAQVRARLRGRP